MPGICEKRPTIGSLPGRRRHGFDLAAVTVRNFDGLSGWPLGSRRRRVVVPMGTVDGGHSFAFGGTPAISGNLLADVQVAYLEWFGPHYDLGALRAVLAAAAAERLGGDPPWLLVVGGSGVAKTETITPLAGAGAVVTSTVTGEAALLSGTPQKERAKDAHGGLLRRVGDRGILLIKDVTSILSMSRDRRAEVLAALREIYDGYWERNVGSEGGRTLSWSGRLVVIGAVTTAWDTHHAVIALMGDRFVLTRFDSRENRREAGLQAIRNVDYERQMRAELAERVSALLAEVAPSPVLELTEAEMDAVLGVADVVTMARTAVERDYQGNVVQAHAPEMPTRFAKQLAQIVRGGIALGLPRGDAVATAVRCAGDTMPPLRLAVLCDVAEHPWSFTTHVVQRLQLPRRTVDRILQELQLLGLLVVDERQWGDSDVRWVWSMDERIDAATVKILEKRK